MTNTTAANEEHSAVGASSGPTTTKTTSENNFHDRDEEMAWKFFCLALGSAALYAAYMYNSLKRRREANADNAQADASEDTTTSTRNAAISCQRLAFESPGGVFIEPTESLDDSKYFTADESTDGSFLCRGAESTEKKQQESIVDDRSDPIRCESNVERQAESIVETQSESVAEADLIVESQSESIVEEQMEAIDESRSESDVEQQTEAIAERPSESIFEERMESTIVENQSESIVEQTESIVADEDSPRENIKEATVSHDEPMNKQNDEMDDVLPAAESPVEKTPLIELDDTLKEDAAAKMADTVEDVIAPITADESTTVGEAQPEPDNAEKLSVPKPGPVDNAVIPIETAAGASVLSMLQMEALSSDSDSESVVEAEEVRRVRCDVCELDIEESNWKEHQLTIEHQNEYYNRMNDDFLDFSSNHSEKAAPAPPTNSSPRSTNSGMALSTGSGGSVSTNPISAKTSNDSGGAASSCAMEAKASNDSEVALNRQGICPIKSADGTLFGYRCNKCNCRIDPIKKKLDDHLASIVHVANFQSKEPLGPGAQIPPAAAASTLGRTHSGFDLPTMEATHFVVPSRWNADQTPSTFQCDACGRSNIPALSIRDHCKNADHLEGVKMLNAHYSEHPNLSRSTAMREPNLIEPEETSDLSEPASLIVTGWADAVRGESSAVASRVPQGATDCQPEWEASEASDDAYFIDEAYFAPVYGEGESDILRYQCQLCKCHVPVGEHARRAHIAGERHRKALIELEESYGGGAWQPVTKGKATSAKSASPPLAVANATLQEVGKTVTTPCWCEACQCSVPSGESLWQTHINGARHKANTAKPVRSAPTGPVASSSSVKQPRTYESAFYCDTCEMKIAAGFDVQSAHQKSKEHVANETKAAGRIKSGVVTSTAGAVSHQPHITTATVSKAVTKPRASSQSPALFHTEPKSPSLSLRSTGSGSTPFASTATVADGNSAYRQPLLTTTFDKTKTSTEFDLPSFCDICQCKIPAGPGARLLHFKGRAHAAAESLWRDSYEAKPSSCDVCNCIIPPGPRALQQHIAGREHRENRAFLDIHGAQPFVSHTGQSVPKAISNAASIADSSNDSTVKTATIPTGGDGSSSAGGSAASVAKVYCTICERSYPDDERSAIIHARGKRHLDCVAKHQQQLERAATTAAPPQVKLSAYAHCALCDCSYPSDSVSKNSHTQSQEHINNIAKAARAVPRQMIKTSRLQIQAFQTSGQPSGGDASDNVAVMQSNNGLSGACATASNDTAPDNNSGAATSTTKRLETRPFGRRFASADGVQLGESSAVVHPSEHQSRAAATGSGDTANGMLSLITNRLSGDASREHMMAASTVGETSSKQQNNGVGSTSANLATSLSGEE